jgi:glycosyltransferase involved in cell wall biosynthesis
MLAARAHEDPEATARARRPLRVAGIDPELGFGGGEVQVLSLTLELLRRGHRAELFCDPRGKLIERARGSGVNCYPLSIRNSIDIRAGLRLRGMLAADDYDVVHFHTARAHALAPYARGLAGARVVTRRMDYRPNRLFAPLLYNHSVEGVAAISEGVAAALTEAGVDRSRIVIIPSGIDETRFRPPSPAERDAARTRWGLAAGDFAIGAVGALEPRKGHRVMLAALTKLSGDAEHHASQRPFCCLVAGDGPLREMLINEARRLGVEGRVRFIGRVEDTRELLRALDLFVMPSLKEGLGVALLEAMGCGVACIASNVGGAGAAVADGCGIAVQPGDASALADAIARMVGADDLRRELGTAARARVVERYTLGASAETTLKFYFNSLQNAGRGI